MNKFTAITFSGLIGITSCYDTENSNHSVEQESKSEQINKQIQVIPKQVKSDVSTIINVNIKETKEKHEEVLFTEATITTYNDEINQTDATPCINESSKKKLEEKFGTGDLCELHKKGVKTAAIPQVNLGSVNKIVGRNVEGKAIEVEYGDIIEVTGTGNPICDGEYVIADAFNVRYNYKQKVDIFLPKEFKKYNTKCEGAEVVIKDKYREL